MIFVSGPAWQPPAFSPNDAESYVWHYARESGKPAGAGRQQAGPHWQGKGAVPPGASFELHLLQQRPLASKVAALFQLALDAILVLGTLALRSTRGLGAFHCPVAPPLEALVPRLEQNGFILRRRAHPAGFATYAETLKDCAAWLRYDFRKLMKAERSSPLGGISPRQSSALRFRPIRLTAREFTWLAYEAPHARVPGPASRTRILLLTGKQFSGPAPRDETKDRRR